MSSSPTRNIWQKIFLSPDRPRLRAGWRLLLQTLLLLVLLSFLSLALIVLSALLRPSSDYNTLGSQIALALAITISVFLARRFLDKSSFASLGLRLSRQAIADILVGMLITFLMMGAIYLAMYLLGWAHFLGFAWQEDPPAVVLGQVLLHFFVFVLVGWNEELLSRGYHLQTIASGTTLFWGVVISSSIFGLLHLGNPNASWTSAAGIFLAGVFLAWGYVCTGQLWLPIGLHLGWNFFEGVVFGFPVSGLEVYPLMRIVVDGPKLWTGGAFGPEAGLIILPALLIGAGMISLYSRQIKKT